MNNGERLIYEFGGFRLDPAHRILLRDGDPVTVWPKVFDTLVVLLEGRGRIVEKEELMQALWPETFVEESNLTQNIFVLRKILGDDRNGHSFIQTVARRGYKFIAPVREAGLSALESDLPASYWRGRSPFRGLKTFETEDAWLFFGRESETEELLEHLGRSPVLSVVGNSGSGKSSLLRAGLIPALQQGRYCANGTANEQWRIAVFRPSVAPFDYLAETLPSQLAPELGLRERAEFIHDFRNKLPATEDSLRDAVAALAGGVSREAGPTRILLMVDQFEELFTLTDDRRTRESYIDSLLCAAGLENPVPVHVVLAVRADFYPECMEHAELSRRMAANQYNVGRMSHEQLRESIEKRLQLASARAEAGLIDSLLEDAGAEPGNLALLEHALGQLWEKCGGFACTLTNKAYAEIGRLRGALGRHADEVYAGLRDEAERQLAKKIFLELVHVGDGAQDARRRVHKADLLSLGKAAEIDLLLAHLASSRLISTGEEDHESFVEVSHEALIREWPLLREWLAQNREDLRLERRLQQAAEEWQSLNRDKGALLQGARLAQAEEWLGRHPDVPVLLQDFVQSSICAREVARERELARQKAAARRLRWFSGALAVLLMVAIGAAWFTHRQKTKEKSRAMAAQSGELLQRDHGRALDLAIRSWETAHTDEAREAVAKALPQPIAILQHEGIVSAAAFSSDGRRVVTGSYDNTARVWDATDGHLLFILRGHTGHIVTAGFSPDDKQILTSSEDHTARIWNAEDGHLVAVLRGHSYVLWQAEFSPDGRRVVTASGDSTARVWSASDGRLLLTLQGHTKPIISAAFSPDGKQIITSSWDKTARIWDSADGHLLKTLQFSSEVNSARFSPDNRVLAVGAADGTMRIWNNADGHLIATVHHDGTLSSLRFSHDGKRIVTSVLGPRASRVWSAENGRLLLTLQHNSQVNYAQFSADDRLVSTAGFDGVARIWDSTDGSLLATLDGHSGPVWAAQFSPDGQRIITHSADKTARIWNTAGVRTLAILQGSRGYVNNATFSRSGQRILTVSGEVTARVWSPDGRLLHALKGHTSQVIGGQFSPDGQRIVTTAFDGTGRVWNAADGSLLSVLQGRSDYIFAQFSPDGQRIVTGGADKTAHIWNAVDGKLLVTLNGHTGAAVSVQFSPDGKRIVSASYDKTARIWNAADGGLLAVLRGHTDRVWRAEFSPDGQRIVTFAPDNVPRVWNSADGSLLFALNDHSCKAFLGTFSPDGTRIVTVSADKTACLWNTADGRLLAVLKGHTDKVYAAQFSPDGRLIVTASPDNTARIWNANDGSLVAIAQGHTYAVSSAQFSPDGQRIVTGSMDATARVWQIVTLDDVRRILGR